MGFKKSHFIPQSLGFLFLFLFALPFFIVFRKMDFFDAHLLDNKGIFFSLLQALVSTLASLCFASLCSWCWWLYSLRLPTRWRLAIEYLFLLPSFFPPLLVMVSVLSVFPFFPFGFWGVVSMHVFFEVGLLTVFLTRRLQEKIAPFQVVWCLYRTPFYRQWLSSFFIMKKDIFLIFCFLFTYFLTSLSVPMIMSGSFFSSLELLIYSSLRRGLWTEALHFYAVQLVILIILQWGFVSPHKQEETSEEPVVTSFAGPFLGSLLGLLPSLLLLLGLFGQLPKGVIAFQREGVELLSSFGNSLLLGFLAGGSTFALLLFCSSLILLEKNIQYLGWLVIPSPSLLAFLFVSPEQGEYFKLIVLSSLFALVFLPTLLKMGFLQKSEAFNQQLEMATWSGASWWKCYRWIVFPQVLPWISLLSGISAIWAMGDFALTRLFFTQDITLGLQIQSFVEHYRWDQAMYLATYLLLAASFVFFFFGGLAYVAYQKITS